MTRLYQVQANKIYIKKMILIRYVQMLIVLEQMLKQMTIQALHLQHINQLMTVIQAKIM